MPNTYVRTQWLNRVEYAGVIANGRVFRGAKNRWATFLTLGTDYGEYIDVTIPRAFAFRDGDVVHGTGRIITKDRSDHIQSTDPKLYTLTEWAERSILN